MHRLFKCQAFSLDNILFHKSCKGSVYARMQQAGAGVGRIGDHTAVGLLQNLPDIVLMRDEVDHRRHTRLLRKKVEQRIVGVFAQLLRNAPDRPALVGLVLCAAKPRRDHIFKPDQLRDILKVTACLHTPLHFPSCVLTLQRGDQPVRTALLKLRRQNMDQLRGACGVGVYVARYIHAVLPRLFDQAQHLRHGFAPVVRSDGFQMADLKRRFERLADQQHLPERLDHAVPLLPHVDGERDAAFVERRKRADQSVCGIEDFRRIAKTERHAQRAVGKRLFHIIMQVALLPQIKIARGKTGNERAQRSHADQHGVMKRQLPLLSRLKIVLQRGKAQLLRYLACDGGKISHRFLRVFAGDRRHGKPAVAVDERRQAL